MKFSRGLAGAVTAILLGSVPVPLLGQPASAAASTTAPPRPRVRIRAGVLTLRHWRQALAAVVVDRAPGRASHNPPVVGSSPTRPTNHARLPANSACQVCTSKTSTLHRAAPLRLIRASAVIKETLRASAKATYWAS